MRRFIKKNLHLFIVFTFTFLTLLELFTYSGFVKKHFIFPVNYYLVFSFALLLIALIHRRKNLEKLGTLFFISAITLLFLMVALGCLEISRYPNYIFTKLHIELRNFPLLIGYLLSIDIILMCSKYLFNVFRKGKFYYLIFSLLFTIYIFNNSVSVAGTIRRLLPPALVRPLASYSDKMSYLWSEPYRFLEIVKRETPDDAFIFIPPKDSAHAITGNQGFCRYFLYPRNIASYNPDTSSGGFLISSPGNELGNGSFGRWPDFNVDSDFYYLVNPERGSVEKIIGDYKFDNLKGGEWGLIKI